MSEPRTVGDLIRAGVRARADAPFLLFENERMSWEHYYWRSVRMANLLREILPSDAPPHVGVLMDNRPEFVELLGGCALSGSVLVGINSTRRGAELERDIRHTDCEVLFVDHANEHLLDGIDHPPVVRVGPELEDALDAADEFDHEWPVQPDDLYLLVFTSGTAGAPKAVRCSHQRMLGTGTFIADLVELREDDVAYAAMPLFHSNPQQCAYLPVLMRGATLALAKRFSVRKFLPDVRLFGATYFPYSGKPLSHILASEERPNDADNPLRVCFGNEGSWRALERFERRFGCAVIDGFGPSEGAMGFPRRPGDPPGSVGLPPPHIKVLRDDGEECARAHFDENGRILDPADCVGEIVNTAGVGRFEGYYKNPEAEAQRVRDGMYWSGDLGYMDERGFLYFAGRTEDWIRVDGENFTPRPIEEIVERHPGVFACAVYAVPDEAASDRVMLAVQPHAGATLDPNELYHFLAGQPDVSPKWIPGFILVAEDLPRGVTGKILVRELRREKFFSARGELWWRERGFTGYRPFEPADAHDLRARFAASGREHLLDL